MTIESEYPSNPTGMQFHSFVFLVFAAVFFAAWYGLGDRPRAKQILLITASWFFYGFAEWWFLVPFLITGTLDYFAGLAMGGDPPRKKLYLALSLGANLGALGFFKYFVFFARSFESLAGADWVIPNIVLPVGISFYTFQSMSYTIGVYRGELPPTRDPLTFFSFLSMWPQFVAGPIERAARLIPQLEKPGRATPQQQWDGMRLISLGYFKKTVVADNCAPIVNAAFASPPPNAGGLYWWAIGLLFAIQIYCDFSGYSDIARGLAKWMGIDLVVNFNGPYLAESFKDFWNRWHISLSTWFRDYVYIPLGGRQNATRNLWITMLVSGLWHGAAWTFVIWGALHAFFVTVERLTGSDRWLRGLAGNLVVIAGVTVGWIFFRAETLSLALDVTAQMFSPLSWSVDSVAGLGLKPFVLLGGAILVWLGCRIWKERPVWNEPTLLRQLALALLLMSAVYLRGPGSTFIYFQF